MKVLFLKDYFYPENCAGINLTMDMLEAIVQNGHTADVFTPIPCRGIDDKTRKLYQKEKIEKLYDGKVTVYRYWLPYEGKNIIGRVLRYIMQNLIQIIKGITCNYDIAFIGSTPPTMGIVASVLKKLKHKPYLFNVQDVFPDSLVTTGLASENGIAWRIGTHISDISYRNASCIVTISDSMKENLYSKGVPYNKIFVIPNWVDTESVRPIKRENNYLFDELGIPRDGFYVVYAGNLGKAQGAEVIIDAAKLLVSHDEIKFLIFGSGTEADSIKKHIEEEKLQNVKLFGLRPSSEVSYVYSMADISLITCKKGTGGAGYPSKTWSILSSGTMPIACFDANSDLSELLRKYDVGLLAEPEDSEQLKEAILYSYENKDECVEKGKRGRVLVREKYSKEECTQKYIKILSLILGRNNN